MITSGIPSEPGFEGRPVRRFGAAGMLQDILSRQPEPQGAPGPDVLPEDDFLPLHDVPINGNAAPGFPGDTISRILRRMRALNSAYAQKAVSPDRKSVV